MDKNVSIITDLDGRKIVMINDTRFQSRRGVEMMYPDFSGKHGAKAKSGWYRYTTRFGLPVYDEDGVLERYNIFTARMLVRCDEKGKLYLYDFVRVKKETSRPHEQ